MGDGNDLKKTNMLRKIIYLYLAVGTSMPFWRLLTYMLKIATEIPFFFFGWIQSARHLLWFSGRVFSMYNINHFLYWFYHENSLFTTTKGELYVSLYLCCIKSSFRHQCALYSCVLQRFTKFIKFCYFIIMAKNNKIGKLCFCGKAKMMPKYCCVGFL
jgi:hypothetical protein